MGNSLLLIGGSFDPPHLGHLKIYEFFKEKYENILILPCCQNPFKSNSTLDSHRLKMLELMFPKDIISTYELNLKTITYSYNTVKYYLKFYDEIHFAIGSENITNKSIKKWYKYNELLNLITFKIVLRHDYEIDFESIKNSYSNKELNVFKENYYKIELPDCSSSNIRINNDHTNLTEEVRDYVIKNKLYSS